MPLNTVELSFAPYPNIEGGAIMRAWHCCLATLLGDDFPAPRQSSTEPVLRIAPSRRSEARASA